MSISISYLSPGSKITDSTGQTYILIAQNHYEQGQSTLLTENCVTTMQYSSISKGALNYESSDIHEYLKNTYINTLSNALKRNIVTTKITFTDILSSSMVEERTLYTKCFILSDKELGNTGSVSSDPHSNTIDYMSSVVNRRCDGKYWTRTELSTMSNYELINMFGTVLASGYHGLKMSVDTIYGIRPAFNVSHELMVEEDVENGYYRIIESIPPQMQNIPNLLGNYGGATTINYSVVNEEGHELTHYFSIDNGSSWQIIKPSKNNDNYYFNYVFNEINTYYCRIKVVDTIGNSNTSNMFTVTLSHSIPSITILGHNNLDFRFKVNCITSELSKIEIYVNDALKKTITENLDFTHTYSIDKSLLANSKNYVRIKATSKSGMVGNKDIEARKLTYNIPVVGSKVIINNNVYTVESASKSGSNIVLNLEEMLIEKVLKGDLISILQDNVKVKCSLSDSENKLDYKDMKLVKVKTLKGDLVGYIEEKYILEGKGRYSSIKLELEKFNNDVNTGIIELQQAFDYLED